LAFDPWLCPVNTVTLKLTVKRIRNRCLPAWLHRLCNGFFGAGLSAALASVGMSHFSSEHLLHRLSVALLYLSAPIGVLLAVFVRRCSLVGGLAGRDGYDELVDQHDKDKT
jgi:hypothetical protein